MTGRLSDTYVAAIQHDLADVPADASLVGVVRKPTQWFYAAVDENHPELGPPESLLAATKDAAEDLQLRGICEEEAHNAAWDEVGFEGRYRTYLAESAEASVAMDSLCDRLQEGESLALVCYENTAKKRCHRTILSEVLGTRRCGRHTG